VLRQHASRRSPMRPAERSAPGLHTGSKPPTSGNPSCTPGSPANASRNTPRDSRARPRPHNGRPCLSRRHRPRRLALSDSRTASGAPPEGDAPEVDQARLTSTSRTLHHRCSDTAGLRRVGGDSHQAGDAGEQWARFDRASRDSVSESSGQQRLTEQQGGDGAPTRLDATRIRAEVAARPRVTRPRWSGRLDLSPLSRTWSSRTARSGLVPLPRRPLWTLVEQVC
jgi:hypothetical protein